MDINPLSVILVENGSKGDRLLFRYPFDYQNGTAIPARSKQARNPYSLSTAEDYYKFAPSLAISGSVHSFPNKVLSNLFAVKSELCGKKFEIKINDIRFVGHPLLLYQHGEDKSGTSQNSIFSFSVVFALKASASHAVVNCYHEISKRIAGALWHEERRLHYLSEEAKIMTIAQDDIATDRGSDDLHTSPFHIILQQSQLARELRRIYEDLQATGIIHIRINHWILINCCLPQKVYHMHDPGLVMEPATISACMEALRPYHAILLLDAKEDIINNLPLDSSPALKRLISLANPLKSLQTLAADSDLTLSHIFHLVGHLLYFAKAVVIYPLCDSNVYVLASSADTSTQSKIADAFTESFPGACLMRVMSEFSVPVSLSQRRNPLATPQQEADEIRVIVWMLQHHLLIQLHTYIQIVVDDSHAHAASAGIGYSTHKSTTHRHSKDGSAISKTPRVTFASRQSTPELDPNSSTTSLMNCSLSSGPITVTSNLTRMPSDSDMASVLSDDVLSSPPSHKSAGSKSHWSTESILSASLTPSEREAVLQVEAASKHEDLDLFAKLCGYFRGKHHLEEIMYLENVRRSQLLHLLDKFRSILVTFEHEDSACSVFYKTSQF